MWENYCDTGTVYRDARHVEVTRLRVISFDTSVRVCSISMSSSSSSVWVDTEATEQEGDQKTGREEEKRRRGWALKWQKIPDTSIKLVDKMIITNHKWFSFFFLFQNSALSNLIKTCLCVLSVPLFHSCNTLWKYLWDHKTGAGQQLMANNGYGSYPWWGPV